MLGHAETLSSNETLQFEDYDKVVFSYFDPEERKQRRGTAGGRLSFGHGSDSERCGPLIVLFLLRAEDAMQHRPH